MTGLHASGLCAGTVPVLVLLAALAGCATNPAEGETPFRAVRGDRGSEDVRITIQNVDFRDATVYARWNGVRRRVGFVVGKTSKTFRMRWLSERLQFEVDFVGGGGYRTESIDVLQGDHLNFVIMPSRFETDRR